MELVEVLEELDVSGGTPLAKRTKLRHAVEMVEAGDADVLVVAFFDRLVRSLRVQAEVIERVEAAGGGILALDVGEVRADTASRWLSSTLLGAVSEYHRRVTSERTAEAKRRAIARGVPTFPNVPPGYRQLEDGTLQPDEHAPAVAEAFRMRARGATIADVRAHLRAHGVERSYHGVQALLASRVVLGELWFGQLVNESAHPAIVDRGTWEQVQRVRLPRGRRPKSDRLLARAGVLRCGTCGSRMVVGTTRAGKNGGPAYGFYRCPPIGDCARRVTISADVAEQVVVAEVQRLLAGVTGSAAIDDGIVQAEAQLDHAERELDAAVRAFTGMDDVDAVRERLSALRHDRDVARQRLEELRALVVPAVTVTADDWATFTLKERRELITAVIERADVMPGRGTGRVAVRPRV